MTDPQSPIDLNRVPQPCPYLLEYKTSIFPREFAFFIIRLNLPSKLGSQVRVLPGVPCFQELGTVYHSSLRTPLSALVVAQIFQHQQVSTGFNKSRATG